MRKRLPILHNAARGWHVDLPTYQLIAGTFEPITDGLIHANGVDPTADPTDLRLDDLSCIVDFPDTYCHPDTHQIEPYRIEQQHDKHPKWSDPDRDWSWLDKVTD